MTAPGRAAFPALAVLNAPALVLVLAACGGSSDDPVDGGTDDAAAVIDGPSGGLDAPAAIDAAMAGPLTVSGFDLFAGRLGVFITCDAAGACYGPDNTVNKLAAGAMALTVIGNTTNGLATARPTGIALDAQDNLYTNACGGSQGVYELPVGTAHWTRLNTDLPDDTTCDYNTLAVSASGTRYVGFAVAKQVYALPAGQNGWVKAGDNLPQRAQEITTRGNDVFVAQGIGVSVLRAGGATWANHGTDHPGNAIHIRFDGAGNLYTVTYLGGPQISRLAAGAAAWVATTGINAGNASDVVFDDMDNGFVIAKPDVGAVNGYTLMKLPAGATTWTRVLDLPANVFDPCRALAYDHHGHLVAQCGTTLLRTRP